MIDSLQIKNFTPQCKVNLFRKNIFVYNFGNFAKRFWGSKKEYTCRIIKQYNWGEICILPPPSHTLNLTRSKVTSIAWGLFLYQTICVHCVPARMPHRRGGIFFFWAQTVVKTDTWGLSSFSTTWTNESVAREIHFSKYILSWSAVLSINVMLSP